MSQIQPLYFISFQNKILFICKVYIILQFLFIRVLFLTFTVYSWKNVVDFMFLEFAHKGSIYTNAFRRVALNECKPASNTD